MRRAAPCCSRLPPSRRLPSRGTSPMTSEPQEPPTPEPASKPAGPPPGRRSFLRGLAGGVAGGVVAGGAGGTAAGYFSRSTAPSPAAVENEAAMTGRLPAVPFHGKHQAGILPGPTPVTAVVSFDVTAQDKTSLRDLMQTVTDRARFLTAGGTPAPVGISGPSSDSDVLGPDIVPDGLTVLLGVGATLFDDRFGLAAAKRAPLTKMTSLHRH